MAKSPEIVRSPEPEMNPKIPSPYSNIPPDGMKSGKTSFSRDESVGSFDPKMS